MIISYIKILCDNRNKLIMKRIITSLITLATLITLNGCKKNETEITTDTDSEPTENLPFTVPPHTSHTFVNGVCECGIKENDVLKDLSFVAEQNFDQIVSTLFAGQQETTQYKIFTTLAKVFESNYIGKGNITYKRYNFTYASSLLDDSPITLSGCLTIPNKNEQPFINSIVISSHPTFVDKSDAPTKGFEAYCIPSLIGAATIEFDLLGYGSTEDKPVDYHCRHLSSKSTADGVMKAFSLLEDNFDVNTSELKVFNLGYSQGGYDSLAFLRYIEQDATDLQKSKIKITETYSGSGAYDPFLMFTESISNDDFPSPEYLVMAIISGFSFHSEMLNGLEYKDLLTAKGLELLDIIQHKNAAEIASFKSKIDPVTNEKYVSGPKDIFAPELFNSESEILKTMKSINDCENLIDGSWMPTGTVYLYFSEKDELVTPKCSHKALELWKELPNIKGYEIEGTHTSAALQYYLKIIANIADQL